MLFYFVFVLLCMGRLETVFKGVYIREKTPRCVHWLFICVLCCYIHWIYFNLFGLHKFVFLLLYVCTDFFSTFIDYFKIFSINYILTSFVFLNDTGFVTELHFTKSYH